MDRLAGYETRSTASDSGSKGKSSECPNCDTELEEKGYRRLKRPSYGFEAGRDVVGKLNIRKRALKTLNIKANPGGFWPPSPPLR